MKRKLFLPLLATILLAPAALAEPCTQPLNKVVYTGVESAAGQIFVHIEDQSPTAGCGCGNFRFSPANVDTDKVLAILLEAKKLGRNIRVDILDALDCDTAYRVYIL